MGLLGISPSAMTSAAHCFPPSTHALIFSVSILRRCQLSANPYVQKAEPKCHPQDQKLVLNVKETEAAEAGKAIYPSSLCQPAIEKVQTMLEIIGWFCLEC